MEFHRCHLKEGMVVSHRAGMEAANLREFMEVLHKGDMGVGSLKEGMVVVLLKVEEIDGAVENVLGEFYIS